MEFRPEAEIREHVAALFAAEREGVRRLLPEAEVEHVGETAVPGR
jgi:GrpB-like predicted nucleotidyltransferase (UPF0157 family)